MKCNNCGFESETNFCPMCGAEMKTCPTPQASAPFTQNISTQVHQDNHYIPNRQSGWQNTQANQYQPQPNQQSIQNIPTAQNQPQIMQNPQTSVNMQFATPPVIQPVKQKNKATTGIVVAVILGAIILAGTIIISYARISEHFKEESPNTFFELEPDLTNYHTGDVAKTFYGNITLKSMEEVEIVGDSVMYDGVLNDNYYNDYDLDTQYVITFTIENTSDKALTVTADDFSVSYSDEYGTKDCQKITENETQYPQAITLKSGERKDFSVYCYVPAKAYSLVTRYRYSDEANNKKYTTVFLDSIDYKSTEMYSSSITHPQNLPFGQISVWNIVEKESTDNSSKVYDFTFSIINNSTDTIEISSNDFAINGRRSDLTFNNYHHTKLTTDEIIKIEPNQIGEITISTSIWDDCDLIYIYYKLNNHITNPDTPVGNTNYNVYWTTEKPQKSLY